jgi:hypothetical protein
MGKIIKEVVQLNPKEFWANTISPDDWGLYLTHAPPYFRQVITADPWSLGGPTALGYTEELGFFITFSAMSTGYGIGPVQSFPPEKFKIEFNEQKEWLGDEPKPRLASFAI